MACFFVLNVGKRRIATKALVDGEDILSVERLGDAIVGLWNRDVEDLHPAEEAGEELMDLVGGELLERHDDERGIFVFREEPIAEKTYAAIVASHRGRWIANLSGEEGAVLLRDLRREIQAPDVPKSRLVEIFVMPPARAMQALDLREPPLRVVCMDRMSDLTPIQVSAFYKPLLSSPKRRVWSDGSREQLVTRTLIVDSEITREGTLVRLAAMLPR